MSLPISERQGFLHDLSALTLVQLQDLKSRQLKILENPRLVNKLTDKGEKLKNFVKKLDRAIKAAAEVDKTTEMLKKMAINNADSAELQEQIKGVINTGINEKVIKIVESEEQEHVENLEDVQTPVYTERIIEKVKNPNKSTRKFVPNRGTKTEHMEDIPPDRKPKVDSHKDIVKLDKLPESVPSTSCTISEETSNKFTPTNNFTVHSKQQAKHNANENHESTIDKERRLKFIYDENLEFEMAAAKRKCKQVKMISIADSFKLQQYSSQKLRSLQAEQATKRLAERFKIKNQELSSEINLEHFKPEGTAYRNTDVIDSDDGCEEDEMESKELDYLD